MSQREIANLRAELDDLIDRDPIRAHRLAEAIGLLEQAESLKTKAASLLDTTATAQSDRRMDGNRGNQST